MARSSKSAQPNRESQPVASGEAAPNPAWFKPVMFGFMIVGLLWVVTYYISEQRFPIASLGSWNIAIGLGLAFIGFLMTPRWR